MIHLDTVYGEPPTSSDDIPRGTTSRYQTQPYLPAIGS